MPLIVETGVGLRVANSYVPTAFVTTYLTERGRETENSWSTSTTAQQEAAAVAATQYIDTRWADRLKGIRLVEFVAGFAEALVTFSGQPTASQTLTLGDQVYTFVSSLTTLGANEVLIGATTDDTVTNLINAINGGDGNGTTRSSILPSNSSASAALLTGSTTIIRLTSRQGGVSGNSTVLSETADNVAITTAFVNGLDGGRQALEFPRQQLYDRRGDLVEGIPLNLKYATAEYAVRARSASLYRDPTVDDRGRAVTEKFEKVGPIEERTVYEDGAALSQLLKPYPAADRLMAEYLTPPGGVSR